MFIHLQQPGGPGDARDDPFWEYGTFGCTGCHDKQVKSGRLDGACLGFIQGGADTLRLVYLTPPVRTTFGQPGAMVEWEPHDMPFRFNDSPLLIDQVGYTNFPLLRQHVEGVKRSAWLGKLSSAFRSRTSPLAPQQAAEVIEVFERARTQVGPGGFASQYCEAIPPVPMDCRSDRAKRYRMFLRRAGLPPPIGDPGA